MTTTTTTTNNNNNKNNNNNNNNNVYSDHFSEESIYRSGDNETMAMAFDKRVLFATKITLGQ